MAEILKAKFGNHIWDDSAEETARRLLGYYDEMSQYLEGRKPVEPGLAELPFSFTTFEAEDKQMIMVANIEFASMCQHHMLPIIGVAHVAYIPNQIQVGLSKIPRLVEFWSKRPQVQERLTGQIAKDLNKRLHPMGVMVVVEAQHSCLCARGIRSHNGMMITSLPLGVFLSNPSAREEYFNLLNRSERH
jgi:GTP cyclohydrolase I